MCLPACICLQSLCAQVGPAAAQPERSPARAQQQPSHLEEQNLLPQKRYTQMSCKLACKTRTCNVGSTALSPSSFTESWWAPKTSGPGGAFREEGPFSSRRAARPRESVVIASWPSNKNPKINRVDVCLAGTIKENTCQSHNDPEKSSGTSWRRR